MLVLSRTSIPTAKIQLTSAEIRLFPHDDRREPQLACHGPTEKTSRSSCKTWRKRMARARLCKNYMLLLPKTSNFFDPIQQEVSAVLSTVPLEALQITGHFQRRMTISFYARFVGRIP